MWDIHENSDGARIDNREDYGSSTSLFNHSSKDNVHFDGVAESMSQFE